MRRRDFLGLSGAAALVGLPRGVGAARPGRAGVEGERTWQEDPRLVHIGLLIEARMAEYRIPGVAFGLVSGGEAWLRGFGITNLDNPQPVDPRTVFPIASISKTVVATSLFRLSEEGRVDLEAPVQMYLPDFRVADEEVSRTVRLLDLLTHTPGWEGQLGTPDRGPRTLEEFVRGLSDLPRLAGPGEVWSYNNAGFGVAGRVIEVVTGQEIGDALATLVFDPLGLDQAFSRTGTAMTWRFAAPHRDRDGHTEVIRPFRLPANVPAGGTAMSLASLIRYARFHLGHDVGAEGPTISMVSREAMRTALVRKNPATDEMGAGWHLRRLDGVLIAAHGGTLGGHCLHVRLVPERDFAFAILTNHNQGWRLIEEVGSSVLDVFQDLRLAPGQRTGGNRGGNERMTLHSEALDVQPDPAPYAGLYRRPPVGETEVAVVEGRLVMRGGGSGDPDIPLVFWASDMAYTDPPAGIGYPYQGMPVEFVRDGTGTPRWMRVNGRIARRD